MIEDFAEHPIAREVVAVKPHESAESRKLNKVKSWRERFTSKEAADIRKHALQAIGVVASVSPIFPPKAVVKTRLRKRQVEPFGTFCADWKVHQ